MSVKLEATEKDLTIPVSEMKDGEIGVITQWSEGYEGYEGRIVQRYGDVLITIGENIMHTFKNVLKLESPECRVRILTKGEKLIIE